MARNLQSINNLVRGKNHAKRRIFAVLLSLVMCGTMVFGGAGAAFADDGDWTAPTQTVAMGYSGSGSQTVTGTITESSHVECTLFGEYYDENDHVVEGWRQFDSYFVYSVSLRANVSYSILFNERSAYESGIDLYLVNSEGRYVARSGSSSNVISYATDNAGGGTYYLIGIVFSSDGEWDPDMNGKYILSIGVSNGTISGAVSGDASLENVAVTLYRRAVFADGEIRWNRFSETLTQSNGSYQLTGLAAGEYMIEFAPVNSIMNAANREYLAEYYSVRGNAYSIDLGDLVALTDTNMSQNGINAWLDIGGRITGRVTNEYGEAAGYGSLTVSTFPMTASTRLFGCNIDASGNYTVSGLPTGTYVLYESGPLSNTVVASGTVNVTAPNTITGPDLVMKLGHSFVHEVAFDTQGGEEIDDRTFLYGSEYGTLPTPTRAGYTFDGWYYPIANGSVYGTKVTSSMLVRFSHTLYAHWTQLPSQQGSGDPPAYDPSTPPASTVTGTPAPVADIPAAKAPTAPGGASPLPPSVIFADGTRANVAWSSSDSSVASIDSAGNLVAASEGTVTLTATATDGSGKTQTITVTIAKPVTKIRTPLEAVYLKSGASIALPLCADSLDASGKADIDAKLSYESANPKIATVDANGKITAKKAGKTAVTVTALNGKSMKVKVNVTAKATPLKKFTVAKAPKAMKPGKAAQLKIKLTPAAATNLKVSFKSSKKAVATVDKAGKITAIKKGKTKITVKVGSKKIVLNITVK